MNERKDKGSSTVPLLSSRQEAQADLPGRLRTVVVYGPKDPEKTLRNMTQGTAETYLLQLDLLTEFLMCIGRISSIGHR